MTARTGTLVYLTPFRIQQIVFVTPGRPSGRFVGRNKKEDFSLLQMAHAFEQATGFGKKHPVIA